tara:strand:- start:25 stop:909 length:885 start_codon:yes stop_codon:yes gene_type:complete
LQIERQEIRIFSAVVEESGFSRAAERLGISQSAVSQAIANLEHKLDTQLLIRKQQPELTETGMRLFSFAQTVTHEEYNALEDIQQIRSGALSTLNLAMNSVVNRFFGKELLLEFCERNPLTRLQLTVAPSRELVIGVEEGRWELGIGPFQRGMPGHFELLPFFNEVRTLVVHDNHPLLSELRSQPEQALHRATLLTSYLDDAARRPGNERLRNAFGSVWEVGHLDLRLALAEAGKGVTYLSDRLLETVDGYHPINGPGISTIDREVGLYYKKHRPLSEGAKRFVAICKDKFRTG